MKIILSIFFLASSLSYAKAQTYNDCIIGLYKTGNGWNCQLTGNESNLLIDSLFYHHPKTKRKGYVWKFKNVTVDGVEKPVTFFVHKGIRGTIEKAPNDTTLCKGSSYFHTFTSEKYKKRLLDNRKPTEQDAVIIYLSRGHKYGIPREEAELVKEYLMELFS